MATILTPERTLGIIIFVMAAIHAYFLGGYFHLLDEKKIWERQIVIWRVGTHNRIPITYIQYNDSMSIGAVVMLQVGILTAVGRSIATTIIIVLIGFILYIILEPLRIKFANWSALWEFDLNIYAGRTLSVLATIFSIFWPLPYYSTPRWMEITALVIPVAALLTLFIVHSSAWAQDDESDEAGSRILSWNALSRDDVVGQLSGLLSTWVLMPGQFVFVLLSIIRHYGHEYLEE